MNSLKETQTGGGGCVSLECTLILKENETHTHGKLFLDSCKIFIIHTPESKFWRENRYHCSSLEGYFQCAAASSAFLPQFYWPGASLRACIVFTGQWVLSL